MASGDTTTEALLNILGNGGDASVYRGCCNTKTQTYILDAIDRVDNLEEEVDELKNNPDVVDIVATYADLEAYDTQHLTDKDVIRVLADEGHDGESTYYRYSKQNDSWTYIGTVGDYYTKTAADAKFQDKLTAGSNITISEENEISATDTTYSNFTGTDGVDAGAAGLVPAPATTDAGKFLKASGTWDKAVAWDNVFADDDQYKIKIGGGATTAGTNAIAIGRGALSRGTASVSIGTSSEANNTSGNSYGTAIGYSAKAPAAYSVAIGANATTTSKGEFAIGTTGTNGYNDSAYRLLTGLYDPQNAHDAATKGYVDGLVGDIETALNIINNGTES